MDAGWKDIQKPYSGTSLQEQSVYTSGYMRVLAQQGWQCPLCNRIYGPFVQECYHCNNQESTLTTTTYPSDTTGTNQSYTVEYPSVSIGEHTVHKAVNIGKHAAETEETKGKHSKRRVIKGGN